MPSDLGEIRVQLVADMKKLSAGLKSAGTAIKRFSGTVQTWMSRAGAAIARFVRNAASKLLQFAKKSLKRVALALAAAGVASVKMAMDAEESENLFTESMGRMGTAARKWSVEYSKALGMNDFEVRRNIGTFYVMLESMELGEQAAYDMAKGMTELSYDMASFYNLKPEEAFQKIRSGIVGMSRPLMDLGINIQDEQIKTYALKEGLIALGDEMTLQQKVTARYGLLLERTTKAQGDMARTLDSATNVFRALWSQIKLTAILIGNELMPYVTKVGVAMREWFKNNKEEIADYVGAGIARLREFIEFMRRDWKAGVKLGLDVALELFRGFSTALLIMMEDLFYTIGANISVWVQRGLARKKLRAKLRGQALEELKLIEAPDKPGQRFIPLHGPTVKLGTGPEGKARIEAMKKQANELADKRFASYERHGYFEKTIPDAEGATNTLSKLGAAAEDTKNRIAELASEAQVFSATSVEMIRASQMADDWLEEMPDKMAEVPPVVDDVTDALKGAGKAADDAGKRMYRSAETIESHWFNAAKRIQHSMADAFQGMIEGTKSVGEAFEEFGRSIVQSMTMAIADMIAQWMMFQILTGLGGVFKNSAMTMAGRNIGNPTVAASTKHGGGDVGIGGVKAMPAGMFANAPRLHGGLKADEYATVLQRGEEVRSKDEVASGGTAPQVVINNNTGTPMKEGGGGMKFDGKRWVTEIVTTDIYNNGPIRTAMQGMG